MKNRFKLATLVVVFVLILAEVAAPLCSSAAAKFAPTSTIELADGVTLQTQVTKDSFITDGQRINLLTVDLSKPYITMEMMLNRNSNYTLRSVKTVMNELDTSMSSKKRPIAGINADWFHSVGSSANYAGLNCDLSISGTYYMPFGCDIVNGEILCSQYSYAEWLYAGAIPPMVFGITSDNKALVGEPKIVPSIKNTTKGTTVKADGINRAPVKNSVMVYNNALRDTYSASADSYEVIIEITSANNKFYTAGTKITGKVVKITPAGTAKTTKLTSKNIIINAKYSEDDYKNKTGAHSNGIAAYNAYLGVHPISTVKSNYTKITGYSVGDTVEITTSITDSYGAKGVKSADWKKCQFAAGGNFTILKNGSGVNEAALAGDSSYYPTTMIGMDKNGKVMIANCTKDAGDKTGVGVARQGVKMNEMTKFAKALGFYNCFLFDGGGSATMITATSATNGKLVDRGNYDDGQIRSVFNSFIVYYDVNKPVVTATPEPTAKPTVKPTAAPTTNPTSASTDAPATANVTPTAEVPADVTEVPTDVTEVPADVTEAPADVTEPPAEATETPTNETENKGCKSVIGTCSIVVLAAALLVCRKKDNF